MTVRDIWIGRRLRHGVAGVGAGLLMAAGPSAVAVPEAAATPVRPDSEVRLSVEAPRSAVLYDASEGAEGRQDDFEIFVKPHGGVARNVDVTVDARALLKVGSLKPGHRCTGEGGVFHCRFSPRSLKYGAHSKPFRLRGKDGAEPGAGGTVRMTARADNASAARARTRLEVKPPALAGNRPERVPGRVAPGQKVPLRPSFASPGRWTVRGGYWLKIDTYGGHLALERRYSNCWYSGGHDDTSGGHSARCWFDTPLPPHSAWRVAQPLFGRLERDMPAESVRYDLVYGERDQKPSARRGTGPELGLERIPAKDVRKSTQGSALLVYGTAQLDYTPVVRGAVRGRVGRTVSVRIGVRNVNGGRLPGINPDHFEITPPEGTTIVGTPYEVDGDPMSDACRPSRTRPGVRICPLDSEALESPDGTQLDGNKGPGHTLTVRFRIDRKVAGARGSVRVVGKYDRTPGNDTLVFPADAVTPSRSVLGCTVAGGAATLIGWTVLLRRRLRRARPPRTAS